MVHTLSMGKGRKGFSDKNGFGGEDGFNREGFGRERLSWQKGLWHKGLWWERFGGGEERFLVNGGATMCSQQSLRAKMALAAEIQWDGFNRKGFGRERLSRRKRLQRRGLWREGFNGGEGQFLADGGATMCNQRSLRAAMVCIYTSEVRVRV